MSAQLHLFGNWKWTGPAELAVTTALDADAQLLLGDCPFHDLRNVVLDRALALGLKPRVLRSLQKHWNPLRTPRAAAEIAAAAQGSDIDVLHVHLDSDHAAARAARCVLDRRPALVRSVHQLGPYPLRTRRLLQDAELLIAPTRGIAARLESALGLRPFSVAVRESCVDLDRFQFTEERRQNGRARLCIAPDERVAGIVARIQPQRRFEFLWDVWQEFARVGAPLRLVVIGRGTLQKELAEIPVEQRALKPFVTMAGYQEGEQYLETLAACDFGIFLVPGTDVGCRAVREWMAMQRAVFCTPRAPLPELIHDGSSGRVLQERVEDWVQALSAADLREFLDSAGRNARAEAERRFAPALSRKRLSVLHDCAACMVQGHAPRTLRKIRAIAAVRPGLWGDVRTWAESCGLREDEVWLIDPWRSRDIVLETLQWLRWFGAQHLLIEHHPEWDAIFIEEMHQRAVETWWLATEDIEAREQESPPARRWMEKRIDRVFRARGLP